MPVHVQRRSLLAAVALVAAGCGGTPTSSPSSNGKTAVTVGVIPIVDVTPIYLGVKQGFFSAEGLDVKLETAQGDAAIVPAVAKGDVDAGQVVEPFLTIATGQGDRQVVSNYAGTDPDLTVACTSPRSSTPRRTARSSTASPRR